MHSIEKNKSVISSTSFGIALGTNFFVLSSIRRKPLVCNFRAYFDFEKVNYDPM